MDSRDKTYNSICRVCLKHNKIESMVSLREKPGRRSLVSFGKVLTKLARISIDYDDFLPTKICQNCKKMIQNINSFKLMCKNNDRKLRKFVNMAKDDREKCKDMIREYTLFSQYFPTGTFKNHVSPSAKFQNTVKSKKKQESSSERLKSESFPTSSYHDSDDDYSFNIHFEDDFTEPKNHRKNVDLFLDSIENEISKKNHQTLKPVVESNAKVDTLLSVEKTLSSQTKHISKPRESSQALNIDKFLDSLEEAVTTKTKRIKIKTKPKPPQHTVKNFHCDICTRTLASQASYNYHMQRHTKYRYICDQCGRGFPCKVPLRRHMVINHDKGPFLRCNHCDFKCSRRYDLVEHIRIHTGERPFTCEKCGLTFRRRAIWKNHLIQHQEKNIPCPVCQKMFHRQCDVNWHINSAHERTYFYLCSVCNASYATNKTVRKHMLSKHGIPRDKQGKITRVTKDSNSVIFTDNNVPMIGYPAV